MSVERALQAAFSPIHGIPTNATAGTVDAVPIVLFTDLATTGASRTVKRRFRIANTHASQTLAIHLVALGTAAGGAQRVNTRGAMVVFPRTAEAFSVDASLTILVVGEGSATTFEAVSDDL